ncbi:hypothetical protein NJB1507_41000 [Mycobacterium marinum]|nr:hypothetical protein NJB1507_41000 [Mycobacterium marinum]
MLEPHPAQPIAVRCEREAYGPWWGPYQSPPQFDRGYPLFVEYLGILGAEIERVQ